MLLPLVNYRYDTVCRLHVHRYKADEAYLVEGSTPVGAYLDVEQIVSIAVGATAAAAAATALS